MTIPRHRPSSAFTRKDFEAYSVTANIVFRAVRPSVCAKLCQSGRSDVTAFGRWGACVRVRSCVCIRGLAGVCLRVRICVCAYGYGCAFAPTCAYICAGVCAFACVRMGTGVRVCARLHTYAGANIKTRARLGVRGCYIRGRAFFLFAGGRLFIRGRGSSFGGFFAVLGRFSRFAVCLR